MTNSKTDQKLALEQWERSNKVKIIGLDGSEIETTITMSMLRSHLAQEQIMKGDSSVIIQIGAWRILATLLGDTSEPLYKQLLKVKL